MNKLVLFLFSAFLLINNLNAAQISGTAINSENGNGIPNIEILLTYADGGIADSYVTSADGSFVFNDVMDGNYGLEFYSYPDAVIINGDYFLNTNYDNEIVVAGSDTTDVEFDIPPHHPGFTLTGNLYDAITNEQIDIQDFQVQAKLQYYVEFFFDWSTENGTYILENMPDWSYELNIFENDYYEGIDTLVVIDSMDPDTVQIDFYLMPKMGATIRGVLMDSLNNQPIMMAGRTIKLSASNSMFTQTNEMGEFTFINVPPGTYGGMEVTSEDTSYVNCLGSEIQTVVVPEEGVSNLQLFQKQWISIHEVSAENYTFEPGETKTIKFSITNDDLSYGSVWGVNLIFPEGVTIENTTPFYSIQNNEMIFDEKTECSTENRVVWEGWHWIGIPPYASSDGNLDMLNESAMAEVTLTFGEDDTMEIMPVQYEIFYDIHCFNIQPFSFGTIMMQNENTLGVDENNLVKNSISTYPSPATDKVSLKLELSEDCHGELSVFNMSGQKLISFPERYFNKGNSELQLNTSKLDNGLYFYRFTSAKINMKGKIVIAKQ